MSDRKFEVFANSVNAVCWVEKYQFYSLWFKSIRPQTHLPHLRWARHWYSPAETLRSGLSFESSCRQNSTSTLYSAAGYSLCIKDKKCIIYSQSRYRDNDRVLFFSQWEDWQACVSRVTRDSQTCQSGKNIGFHRTDCPEYNTGLVG